MQYLLRNRESRSRTFGAPGQAKSTRLEQRKQAIAELSSTKIGRVSYFAAFEVSGTTTCGMFTILKSSGDVPQSGDLAQSIEKS